jgi:hypothetical protein
LPRAVGIKTKDDASLIDTDRSDLSRGVGCHFHVTVIVDSRTIANKR